MTTTTGAQSFPGEREGLLEGYGVDRLARTEGKAPSATCGASHDA